MPAADSGVKRSADQIGGARSFYPLAASFDEFVGHSKVTLPGKVPLLAGIGAYSNLASPK